MASSPYRHLPSIPKGTVEYERACQLYKAFSSHKSKPKRSYNEYRNNPLEVEAFNAGDTMARLIEKIEKV
jgi:hypothetical protein